MIESEKYIEVISSFFFFLERDFGFTKSKTLVNGNVFYDIEYHREDKIASISYENIENHLEVIIFLIEKGIIPDYDDKSKTLHLKNVREKVFNVASKELIQENSSCFSGFLANNELERMLLKSAKDLRLYLLVGD